MPAGPIPKVMSWVAMFSKYCACTGVRARRSARRVCSGGVLAGACSMALSPASISCRCCSLMGRSASSYSACSSSSAWAARALLPSILNCSWRWAMWTCSAASMVRKWLSAGPHRLPRRVLLWGRKVWRRIKADNSGLWLPTGGKGLQ